MLGRTIADPEGIEGQAGTVAGLGLLDVATVMTTDKSVQPVTARHAATGAEIHGYEIHLGRTEGPDCARPVLTIDGRPDGAMSPNRQVQGTYVHGLFTADAFRRAWLKEFRLDSKLIYEAKVEQALEALADHLEQHIDVARMIAIARSRHSTSASAA
jgi:adenosylcobyric acid synthase